MPDVHLLICPCLEMDHKSNPRKFWRIINYIYRTSDYIDCEGTFIDSSTGLTVPADILLFFLNDYFNLLT